jgi:opacity protein-like surface antigen
MGILMNQGSGIRGQLAADNGKLNLEFRISVVLVLSLGFFLWQLVPGNWSLSPACASMAEITGLGMRSQSMAGLGVAMDGDISACYYNPAGLTGVKFSEYEDNISFNLTDGASAFDLKAWTKHPQEGRHNAKGLESMTNLNLDIGVDIGSRLRDHIGDRDVVLGVSIMLPMGDRMPLAWWRMQRPEDEIYIFYYDDIRRPIIVAGLGAEITPWLSVGAGANVWLELLTNSYAESDVQGNADVAEYQETILVPFPILGVQVKPVKGLTVGFTYRGEVYMDDYGFNEAIIPIDLGIDTLNIRFEYMHHFAHYYTPVQKAVGISYKFPTGGILDGLMIGADVTQMQWSTFLNCFHERPLPRFKDTYVPRIGVEKPLDSGRTIIRAGYSFWDSPVPEQKGEANYLDNDRHVVSMGIEKKSSLMEVVLGKPTRYQLMGQYHYLVERKYHKDSGDTLKFGGWGYTAGLTMEVRY